jgi:hypothetical protein
MSTMSRWRLGFSKLPRTGWSLQSREAGLANCNLQRAKESEKKEHEKRKRKAAGNNDVMFLRVRLCEEKHRRVLRNGTLQSTRRTIFI